VSSKDGNHWKTKQLSLIVKQLNSYDIWIALSKQQMLLLTSRRTLKTLCHSLRANDNDLSLFRLLLNPLAL